MSSRKEHVAVRTDDDQVFNRMRPSAVLRDNVVGFDKQMVPAQLAAVAIFSQRLLADPRLVFSLFP